MTQRPVVALTDCADANAQARQAARIAALFGSTPSILPLTGEDPDAAAALTLLDLLRATELTGGPTHPLVLLVNIAPRDGHWPNGSPFCWFEYRGHLVVSSWNERVLSPLAAHLGITQVHITDVREVVEAAAADWAEFTPEQVEEIVRTQFRSLWYVPLLARWLVDGRPVPARPQTLTAPATVQTENPRIAVIDNFGNCKLDVPADALPGYAQGGAITVHSRHDGRPVQVRCYDRLPDVPRGEPGFTTGSSGVGFAELVVRGGSAAELFALRQGDRLLASV
ncbi:SAM hydroxide adenosyltransferase [Streptacidiphilus jiangxiensis]|uniref:S-adenosyl-l-methionine hydroxide adenosyltransferase C-terminal domain-containing protein n=1 Tax=Streptacidiphilus jiangxiensis TaxID=235985 RepID=A0A1H7MT67_STRJI|nr:SAM hydroxide adenosyltransferase [Streptacidiphilus jiangxiensis]SEL13865.1 hypothetical protein SAMN05414137_10627 [Streptacidiphilus jiangxiensis]